MRHSHVREDQETAVIGKQRKSLHLKGRRPSDPLISYCTLESGTGPAQQRKPTVLIHCDKTQRLTYHTLEPKVVMLMHEPIPQSPLSNSSRTNLNSPDKGSSFRVCCRCTKIHAPLNSKFSRPCPEKYANTQDYKMLTPSMTWPWDFASLSLFLCDSVLGSQRES